MSETLLLLCLCFLTSCSNEGLVHYEYNGVTVTRLDKSGESYFYYGHYSYKEIRKMSCYIKCSYPRGKDFMSGFLVFRKGGNVKLIRLEGNWVESCKSSLALKDYSEIPDYDEWKFRIKGNYNNVVWVSSSIEMEKDENQENKCNVKAVYVE